MHNVRLMNSESKTSKVLPTAVTEGALLSSVGSNKKQNKTSFMGLCPVLHEAQRRSVEASASKQVAVRSSLRPVHNSKPGVDQKLVCPQLSRHSLIHATHHRRMRALASLAPSMARLDSRLFWAKAAHIYLFLSLYHSKSKKCC